MKCSIFGDAPEMQTVPVPDLFLELCGQSPGSEIVDLCSTLRWKYNGDESCYSEYGIRGVSKTCEAEGGGCQPQANPALDHTCPQFLLPGKLTSYPSLAEWLRQRKKAIEAPAGKNGAKQVGDTECSFVCTIEVDCLNLCKQNAQNQWVCQENSANANIETVSDFILNTPAVCNTDEGPGDPPAGP